MTVEDFILKKMRVVCAEGGKGGEPCVQNEQALAAQFGVHVRTIRDVLTKLEEEGVLHLPDNQWIKPSLRETVELFEAREAIEGMAARLVVRRGVTPDEVRQLRALAEKIDLYVMDEHQMALEREFHRRVVELSGNQLLVTMYATVIPILMSGTVGGESAFIANTLPDRIMKQEHIKLVNVLQDGSEEDAERAFRTHCTKVINFAMEGAHERK